MTKPKELTTQAESTQLTLQQLKISIAVSPKDIQRGQVALLDRHGNAVGRTWFNRRVTALRVANYAALFGSAALAIGGFPIIGSALYLAVIARSWRIRRRGTGKLVAIDMLAREGKLDEAQGQLDKLPELRRRNPSMYCRIAGRLASNRGDHAKALEWWQQALPHVKGLEEALVKLGMTRTLVLSGRYKEARLLFETVTFPPSADALLTGQSFTRVMFALCDPSASPLSDDELHELARNALEYSHTGIELAGLGWAFDRAGDQDMAQLLATEARERMHTVYLAAWWPELHQWLESRPADPP